MAKTINPIAIIKNQTHNSSYAAKRRAEQNGVYVCKDKEEKVFEFIPLEQVIIKGVTLEQYIQKIKDDLQKEINAYKQALQSLNESVQALSKHIDDQRFL